MPIYRDLRMDLRNDQDVLSTRSGGSSMMKSISLCVALTATVLACMAQPAIAHKFTASPSESGFLGKGGAQTITLGGHAISCKSASIDGSTIPESLLMEIKYETCEAFSKPATVTGAAYVFNANGSGGIAKETHTTITVKPSVEAECVFTLPETSEAVSSVSYTNKASGVTVSSTLEGLTYELKEKGTTVCGKDGEKSSKGEYKGEVTTETYEEASCVFFLGGLYLDSACKFMVAAGLWERLPGYETLEWL
jgi:hypothetical protein